MATAPQQRATREIEYPTGDGKPIAETDVHRDDMVDVIDTLRYHFVDDPNVYISGNLLLYYEEGNPRKHVAPDVLVSFGVSKEPPRKYYQVWKEGRAPNVVIEITSKSTKRVDNRTKKELYRDVLQVAEYFQFDPTEDYLKPSLRGFRLVEGEYQPIQPMNGRIPSRALGLHLESDGTRLRLFDPMTGRRLLTSAERAEAAEAALDSEKQRADALQQKLVEETDRLRQEIEALRRRSNSK
jgi:Uma2 family endonuclease